MIPRFSLYGEPSVWKDNIQSDPNGRWVVWKTVEPYVKYCYDHGVTFESPVVEPVPHTYTDAELREYDSYDALEELDDLNDDVALDVLDYMENYGNGKDDSL